MTVSILRGDCRDVLRTLPAESVHCVVTSPPYWGLRDYGVAGQLGLEASLGEYVDVMVDVFREVRRVLCRDGTLWLNLGDSYAASINGRSAADTKALGQDDRTFRDKPFSTIGPISRVGASGNKGNRGADHGFRIGSGPGEGGEPRRRNRDGLAGFDAGYLKPKDLCGIPWRVAFALQADGWWLRQDIIWSKPNPMPESVTDRCTKAHEYLFLLSKAERYFYDAEAIKEQQSLATFERFGENGHRTGSGLKQVDSPNGLIRDKATYSKAILEGGRNKRSVWEVTTQPFSEAHFATFPPALIEPCIKAGCPKDGTVLDPFGGAGTTGLVADRLQRNAVLVELKPEYAEMARKRIYDDAPLFAAVQTDGYNATDDFARSIDEAYRAIRERKANGGKGWGGWE